MKSILDPTFRYIASFNTDLRKTFARVRRDSRDAARRLMPPTEDGPAKVSSLVGRTAKVRTRSM